ncbi:PHP domain-containing protein [Novisyntrophococcus fermenticellae]|uniref:PHP domain-containing protein n=1 Tax=Novisyntrophococcus fermenticellae TaxID=2068655 RepID=UPI001E6256CB|nr:PHP domain-containing protein [Novisyntrophococcus fermenticellae]
MDLNKNDYGYDYYNSENFFEKYNKIKVEYGNNIDLCAAIEFGEPHLYVNELEELSKKPYDFIIGSIHWIGNMFPCQKVREQYTAKEFYSLYWEEVLKTVKQGGFDSLGHMDFPKRYYGEIYYTETILNEIFKNLLDKNMIIEINTSSLRKGHVETMPGIDLLEIYKTNGGQYITIGFDAHVVEDLCADYQIAKSLVEKVGLREVIYKNRKQILI